MDNQEKMTLITMVAAIFTVVLLSLQMIGIGVPTQSGNAVKIPTTLSCIWLNPGGVFIEIRESAQCERISQNNYKGELVCQEFPTDQYYSYWAGNDIRTFGFKKMCTTPGGRAGQEGIYYWLSWG